MSILSSVLSLVGALAGHDAAAGALAFNGPPIPRGRQPKPGRYVIADLIERRVARHERKKKRRLARLTKPAREAHLVQQGPYSHTVRRPDPTGERAKRRQARCGDCWGTGVRLRLVTVRVGRKRPAVWALQQQPTACGCVRP